MDLRLSKKAVFFKDTFCLSKKSAQMGIKSHTHEDPPRIDACCNFHENVMDLEQNIVVH